MKFLGMHQALTMDEGGHANVYLREIHKSWYVRARRTFGKNAKVMKMGYWSIDVGDINHRRLLRLLG